MTSKRNFLFHSAFSVKLTFFGTVVKKMAGCGACRGNKWGGVLESEGLYFGWLGCGEGNGILWGC